MNDDPSTDPISDNLPATRGYQAELLEESLKRNIVIALDTGSGKTHISILRIKHELEKTTKKVAWFIVPTVHLCEQQYEAIKKALPVTVGQISGAINPDQWTNRAIWRRLLSEHRVIVSTPQVLLDALRHGYIVLGKDISLLVFDEAHHAADKHPYNMIMQEFYVLYPTRTPNTVRGAPVRPAVLGLTASPIFGGNVQRAFEVIERNLDAKIMTVRHTRAELAEHVHRPQFHRALFREIPFTSPSPSSNVRSLASIIASLDIEQDPFVIELRKRLTKPTSSTASSKTDADRKRTDQRFSRAVHKQDTYTHQGLRDLYNAAQEICADLGVWAAQWYVAKVMELATKGSEGLGLAFFGARNHKEKEYLLRTIHRVEYETPSDHPDVIKASVSPKTKKLIECLQYLKTEWEKGEDEEMFRCIVFVTRRDTVIALAHTLNMHPDTKDVFTVGALLGASESSKRRDFLDITRALIEDQAKALGEFRDGKKNLLVSTAVAEEGIDVQACGSVIRWNEPANMVSWAQSRGRARKKKSTFVVMMSEDAPTTKLQQWAMLEEQMKALAMDEARILQEVRGRENEKEDDYMEVQHPETGAKITLDSAIAHLNHFCSVIPASGHLQHQPVYDIDPPDYPVGYHSLPRGTVQIQPSLGPWHAIVTLPRGTALPAHLRIFKTDEPHKSKASAYRHAAFNAYLELYKADLLNEHLLPKTDSLYPESAEEIKEMLEDVEKREGMARVSTQMNAWVPSRDNAANEGVDNPWWTTELSIKGAAPVTLITRTPVTLSDDALTLFDPTYGERPVTLTVPKPWSPTDAEIVEAKEYTRQLFTLIHGGRIKWDDNMDYAYLFKPLLKTKIQVQGKYREKWASYRRNQSGQAPQGGDALFANAHAFGERFSHPTDIFALTPGAYAKKLYQFVRWKFDSSFTEEEADILAHQKDRDLEDFDFPTEDNPWMLVKELTSRMNFLIPGEMKRSDEHAMFIPPGLFYVILAPKSEILLSLFLPSVLRGLQLSLSAQSLRSALFSQTPELRSIPLALVRTAITAGVAGEPCNYQRLEMLGDTVLKFTVSVQLLGEHQFWHEGYLTKQKHHFVSNSRLARSAIGKGLYRWIVRDRLVPRRWRPEYHPNSEVLMSEEVEEEEVEEIVSENENANAAKQGKKNKNSPTQLSTKMLADVVESLLGMAYLHGGFDASIACASLFDIGLQWSPLPIRVAAILARTPTADELPPELDTVEQMIGYTFERKTLLLEALMHASCQSDFDVASYERLEFLGDAVLDMVVTEYLHNAPGKSYSPGHLTLRRSALVNAHFLAYICLRQSLCITSELPRADARGNISMKTHEKTVHLFQCLFHSSHVILEEQDHTYARFEQERQTIEDALSLSTADAADALAFPWVPLIRLQAPKFLSDMVESIIAAVYLDSGGSLDVVRALLERLGVLPALRSVIASNMNVNHPTSRLAMHAAHPDRNLKLEWKIEKTGGEITCTVLAWDRNQPKEDDAGNAIEPEKQELGSASVKYRGRMSKEEVKFRASEDALNRLITLEQLYGDSYGDSDDENYDDYLI